jgi:hypothetical protein
VVKIRCEIGAVAITNIRVSERADTGAIDAGGIWIGAPAHRGKLVIASDKFTHAQHDSKQKITRKWCEMGTQ